jgi:quercetin dioxygenase-like cupin family protein
MHQRFIWLVLVLGVCGALAARAQDANFTGKSTSLDASKVSAGRRLFEAGARSNWHSHPNGQLVFNEAGLGLHQAQGKPMEQLRPGQSTYVGPNIVHWHGAAPDASFTQLSIGWGGSAQWGAPVTDTEYSGKQK